MFLSSLILYVAVLGLIALLLDLLHGRLHHFGARGIEFLLWTAVIVSGYTHIADPGGRDNRNIILRGHRTLHLTFELLTMIVFI